MKLVFIRHGDPDYSIDSLTEKGWREAQLLAERVAKMKVDYFYVSPLGRAKDTAKVSLEKLGRQAEELPWLREFAPRIHRPDKEELKICWDWLPADWTKEENFYTEKHWMDADVFKEANVKDEYEWVTKSFDALLKEHGYERENRVYHVNRENEDTLVFFCHFGVTCVLLSHILGVSPMVLWHGMCAAPTSVTILNTEERREGTASFRMSTFGDISHLYVADEEPAFAARFCEVYHNEGRHD